MKMHALSLPPSLSLSLLKHRGVLTCMLFNGCKGNENEDPPRWQLVRK